MIDTKNLRTLAEAATPGPWGMREIDPDDRAWGACEVIGIDGAVFVSTHVGCVADACYIATFNPKTILSLLDALERKDAAIKKCYSEVIRGLADVVNVHTPDKLFDLDAIPRDPVMAIVSRIKTSMEAITKEIGA